MNTRTRTRTHWALVVTVPLFALLTACGGSSGSGDGVASADDGATATPSTAGEDKKSEGSGSQGGKSAYHDALVKVHQCLRKEGVKGLPEIDAKKRVDMQSLPKDPNLSDAELGKVRNARETCSDQLKAAYEVEPKPDNQKLYEAMLKFAQCMRSNGATKFKNPQMQDGIPSRGGEPNPANPQIPRDVYERAETTCNKQVPEEFREWI